MKLTAFVLFSLFSSLVMAAGNSYQLDMEVTMNNETFKPQVIVKEGETGSITENSGKEERFVDIVATEHTMKNKKGVLMKFVVGTIGTNGQRTIVATPQVFTLENNKATITSEGTDKKVMTLVVTPRKVKM
jgi:type II secretory pathway component GspD/PulD (secretin)